MHGVENGAMLLYLVHYSMDPGQSTHSSNCSSVLKWYLSKSSSQPFQKATSLLVIIKHARTPLTQGRFSRTQS